jgi:hypothetical protein
MQITTSSISVQYADVLEKSAPQIAADKIALRVQFKPIVAGDTSKGVYAKVPAPHSGMVHSVGVKLVTVNPPEARIDPTGDLLISTVDPTVNYDAFFLYTVLEDIPKTTVAPKVWRKTDMHGVGYSTTQVNPGWLYFVILNGPTAETVADIALTVASY